MKKSVLIISMGALLWGWNGTSIYAAEMVEPQFVGKWEGLAAETESVYIRYEFFSDGTCYYESGTADEIYVFESGRCDFLKEDNSVFFFDSDTGMQYWYAIEFVPQYGDCMNLYQKDGTFVTMLTKVESFAGVGNAYYDVVDDEKIEQQLAFWENMIGCDINSVASQLGTLISRSEGENCFVDIYMDQGELYCPGEVTVTSDMMGNVVFVEWKTTNLSISPGGLGWENAKNMFFTALVNRYGSSMEDISKKGLEIYAWTRGVGNINLINFKYNPEASISVKFSAFF